MSGFLTSAHLVPVSGRYYWIVQHRRPQCLPSSSFFSPLFFFLLLRFPPPLPPPPPPVKARFSLVSRSVWCSNLVRVMVEFLEISFLLSTELFVVVVAFLVVFIRSVCVCVCVCPRCPVQIHFSRQYKAP